MAMRTKRLYDSKWPTVPAPIGSTVSGVTIDHANGDLHLTFEYSATGRNSEVTLPAPWTFTSCLLSISSAPFENCGEDLQSASDLVGLEGATLSAIERDGNRIDLIFGSIRLSVSADSVG